MELFLLSTVLTITLLAGIGQFWLGILIGLGIGAISGALIMWARKQITGKDSSSSTTTSSNKS